MYPLHGLGRCDGHHEMVDLRLGKMTRPIQQVMLERKPRRAGALRHRKMSSAPHQTPRYYPKAQIRQGADRDVLSTGSRKTLHPSDNRHRASSAKNSDENQVAAI